MKEKIDLINEFLDGTLKGQEFTTFQEQLKTDKALAEKVDIVRGLRKAIPVDKSKLAKEAELKKTLSYLNDKYFDTATNSVQTEKKQPTPTTKEEAETRSLFPKLAAAASVALLILGGTYFMNSDSDVDFDKLVDTNFVSTHVGNVRAEQEAILPGDEMGKINANIEKAAETADQLFKDDKYAEAKEIYNSLLAKHNNPISKAIYNGNNINWDAMKWNCVLVEVGLGNNEAAKKQIEAILNSDITKKYKERAEALKERL